MLSIFTKTFQIQKCVIIPFLILSTFCFSQKNKTFEFTGILTTSDQQVISYHINFSELENGQIEGVSTTDLLGKNTTKSKIVGSIDHKKNKLTFKEISNISTISTEEDSSFCFIQVDDLKIKKVKGKNILMGDFKGKFPSGKDCAYGTLYLASANIFEDINSNINKFNLGEDTLKKIDSTLRIIDSVIAQPAPTPGVKTYTNEDTITVNIIGEQIIFEVWDGNSEDNDIINIYFNGELISENLVIKNRRQTIAVPLKEDKGIVRVIAVNEGYVPPNTVNFALKNNTDVSPFISKLRSGEDISIKVNRSLK